MRTRPPYEAGHARSAALRGERRFWCLATPTGLEPATSAVTGRRANQLRYGALLGGACRTVLRIPNGIRTRAAAVKGRSPRPLDDGDLPDLSVGTSKLYGSFWHRPNRLLA